MHTLTDPRSSRRAALRTLAAGAGALALSHPARADDWPSKPIRLIVPTPPGSGPDVDSRRIAQHLGPLLGQPVLVDNRPGAATRIATELAVKAPADGYTLLLGTPSLTTAPSLYATLPFDARRDLVPISLLSVTYYALTVNADVPAKTLADYVALVKADARYSNVATYGVGTLPHLAGAWFAATSGAPFKYVHYNTSPPFNDLIAGQTSAIFDAMLPVLGNVRAGRLRVLAISGPSRHPMLPDVPTFAEAGYAAFNPVVWVGVLAPAGTAAPIVEKLGRALGTVARLPEIVAQRKEVISDSLGSTPAEFAVFLDEERTRWADVIRRAHIRLD